MTEMAPKQVEAHKPSLIVYSAEKQQEVTVHRGKSKEHPEGWEEPGWVTVAELMHPTHGRMIWVEHPETRDTKKIPVAELEALNEDIEFSTEPRTGQSLGDIAIERGMSEELSKQERLVNLRTLVGALIDTEDGDSLTYDVNDSKSKLYRQIAALLANDSELSGEERRHLGEIAKLVGILKSPQKDEDGKQLPQSEGDKHVYNAVAQALRTALTTFPLDAE